MAGAALGGRILQGAQVAEVIEEALVDLTVAILIGLGVVEQGMGLGQVGHTPTRQVGILVEQGVELGLLMLGVVTEQAAAGEALVDRLGWSSP